MLSKKNENGSGIATAEKKPVKISFVVEYDNENRFHLAQKHDLRIMGFCKKIENESGARDSAHLALRKSKEFAHLTHEHKSFRWIDKDTDDAFDVFLSYGEVLPGVPMSGKQDEVLSIVEMDIDEIIDSPEVTKLTKECCTIVYGKTMQSK